VQREARFTLGNPEGWVPFKWPAFCERADKFLPCGWRGLAYHLLGDTLIIFEFSADGLAVHPVDLVKSGLSGLLNGTSRLASGRDSMLLRREGRELRRRLYDVLIPASTAGQLGPDGLLLVLPCGSLNSLPFHALDAPDGRRLVEQTVVSYAPSLLTLDLLFSRRSEASQAHRPRPGSLCLVANTIGAGDQAALPAASREVEALQATFGRDAHCLLDKQATVAALNEMSRDGSLKTFEYIHLLAHGRFEEERSRDSRLMLADGALLVDDVADLQLSARAVTLSACEAGVREVFPGEEWVGLTQAFLAAGADCVVSGLWRMPDETMPYPMRLFYQNLLRGMGPAAALCAAQRRTIGLHPEPYDWAALAAVGLP
jgi:CHAT domain-containing protein